MRVAGPTILAPRLESATVLNKLLGLIFVDLHRAFQLWPDQKNSA